MGSNHVIQLQEAWPGDGSVETQVNVVMGLARVSAKVDVAVLPVDIVLEFDLEVGSVSDIGKAEFNHTKLKLLSAKAK